MKKMLTGLLVLIGAIALIGCSGASSPQKRKEELSDINNVYALSAITGVDVTMSASANALLSDGDYSLNIELTDLNILFGVLRDDLYEVNVLESDLEDYDNLLEITVNGETYLYYFNETLISDDESDDDDTELLADTNTEALDDDDVEELDKEIEKKYKIEGLIIYGELEFTVVGFKEVEIEEDEEEFETELKIALDDQNYTIIKYEREFETEESEKEFKLETYKNDKKVREMKLEFEVEVDELKIELEIKEEDKDIKYELKHEQKLNKAYLEYEIEEGENKFEGIIEISVIIEEDGTVRYVYEQ